MRQQKRYPFNMSKHQHDIYFRYYRARNELDERVLAGTIKADEIKKYETLIKALEELLNYTTGIAWMTGKEVGLANETVLWAESMRGIR